MPWKEMSTMDQRLLFIADYLSGDYTKKALCIYYGIRLPTGDKWIDRFRIHGPEGLGEHPRPRGHPRTTAPEIVERIIETKLAHQSFGPKKVMDRLRVLEPGSGRPTARPARSSSETLVRDAGASAFPRIRGPWSTAALRPRAGAPTSRATCPWPMGSALTLTDNHSRFILQCRALNTTTTDAVKPWFEWVFREYGLPETLRTATARPLPRWRPAA